MNTRYDTLPIATLAAIIARLAAAMQSPRCANRAQVVAYWAAACRAYDTANGWEVAR